MAAGTTNNLGTSLIKPLMLTAPAKKKPDNHAEMFPAQAEFTPVTPESDYRTNPKSTTIVQIFKSKLDIFWK